MNQRLALPDQRTTITPIAAFLIGVALVAALALGFALRTWTEHSTSSTASMPAAGVSVKNVEPTRVPERGPVRTASVANWTAASEPLVRSGKPW